MLMRWLRNLRSSRRPPLTQSGPRRWVVLDVESSGLDTRRDRLLAIAAVAIRADGRRAVIDLSDSFEVGLAQDEPAGAPDRANILLHGIGVAAQQTGTPRPQALQLFADFVGSAPVVAFHAAFDQQMIERAFRAEGLEPPGIPWLDLEPLAAVLMPKERARSLDEWMQVLDVHCSLRHQAASDTLATAELLLKLWPRLLREVPDAQFGAVVRLAAQRRWLPG